MKLIKRPDFNTFRVHGDLSHSVILSLENWFDTHLKDHYAMHKDDLVRVDCAPGHAPGVYVECRNYFNPSTHQAYLIKSSITEIKKETAAEYLGWLIKNANPAAYDITFGEGQYDKAKRILEES